MTIMNLQDYLNTELFNLGTHSITGLMFATPLILLLIARILNWFILKFVLRPYFGYAEFNFTQRKSVRRLLAGLLYFLALFLSVKLLYKPPPVGRHPDNWEKIIPILQVIFTAGTILYGFQIVVWLLNDVILRRYFKTKDIDEGRQYTITRLIMYVGFTFGILAILQVAGIELTLLIGGGAALLVGVGLGLQQTFNDLFSGIVILVEGTVAVGDIVNVDGIVAKMRKIGLRVSEVETRDNSILLIPNSKLVVENVHNWSNEIKPTRFQVKVGVSYGSDVRLVEKLLLDTAREHSKVLKKPKPRVQFVDFGNSSLDFVLHFYSHERYYIEFVKSDIRFRVIALFRENNVEIPFPQQDLWLRNPETIFKENNQEEEDRDQNRDDKGS